MNIHEEPETWDDIYQRRELLRGQLNSWDSGYAPCACCKALKPTRQLYKCRKCALWFCKECSLVHFGMSEPPPMAVPKQLIEGGE